MGLLGLIFSLRCIFDRTVPMCFRAECSVRASWLSGYPFSVGLACCLGAASPPCYFWSTRCAQKRGVFFLVFPCLLESQRAVYSVHRVQRAPGMAYAVFCFQQPTRDLHRVGE